MPTVPHTRTMSIDGRTVAYAEAGDPSGKPVIHLHGAGLSRLEVLMFDSAAGESGVRLIGPDRPGCGYSDPNPLLTPIQYAEDLAMLADSLGIDRFAVSGVSSGGMYAMAAAYALPDRVVGVVPVNSATPTSIPDVRKQVTSAARLAYFLAKRMPWLIVTLTSAFSSSAPDDGDVDKPVKVSRAMRLAFPDVKMAELFCRAQAESNRQPDSGYILNELRLVTNPWGFDHTDIAQAVEMFSSTKDGGHRHARTWADQLRNARLRVFPGPHGAFVLPPAPQRIVASMASFQ